MYRTNRFVDSDVDSDKLVVGNGGTIGDALCFFRSTNNFSTVPFGMRSESFNISEIVFVSINGTSTKKKKDDVI